jgi:two-component system, sensor histidine kinase and response regulator
MNAQRVFTRRRSPCTVLVVDDYDEGRASQRLLLESLGFIVHESRSGLEALASAQASAPDIVLLDLVLPEIDGLQLARMIRADPVIRHAVLVAVSASENEIDREQALGAGCDAFLCKPLSPKALLREIRRHIGRLSNPSRTLIHWSDPVPKTEIGSPHRTPMPTIETPLRRPPRHLFSAPAPVPPMEQPDHGLVLVVDDHDDSRTIARLVLESVGFRVVEAAAGCEGLRLATELRPQVVLLDLVLPGLDGWEIARLLRRDRMTKRAVVIAVTAIANVDDQTRAIEAGCDEVLTKPVSPANMVATIRGYVGLPTPAVARIS